jgi:predicted nucleotidyltransferase
MELSAFEAIMSALNRRGVRSLLVGGMAVVAHGHGRMTHDIDLVLDLDRDNILAAMEALTELGYRPRVPVAPHDFADAAKREHWIREKGMTVFNMYSERFRTTPVDLFVEEPFDFEAAYAISLEADLEGVRFRYVDLETLVQMKEAAGRPVDLEDIRQLRLIASDEAT